MSLAAVTEALDELEERSWCAGTFRPAERVAIALPDGDVGAVDDPMFVDWLRAHAEPAPFGRDGETVFDPEVRAALRLVARGAATVAGFDPSDVLPEIEAVLSPRRHLRATLTDVIVYDTGGKFLRHKDTPTAHDLLGTLVVVLPVAHEGGALRIDDGYRAPGVLDWGDPEPGALRWVALYSDADHEVQTVESGARISLTYALHVTDRPRTDPTWPARRARLAAAIAPLAQHGRWPAMIACSRHVIVDTELHERGLEALRAGDRDLADVLTEAGYRVRVRACVASSPDPSEYDEFDQPPPPRFPRRDYMYAICRLRDPITPETLGAIQYAVTFGDDAGGDEDDDSPDRERHPGALGPHILDEIVLDSWVVRATAAATLVRHGRFSESGYFGNEGHTALVYTLAALEVTR